MKSLLIPLREFALPAPRVGSIEAHSGYGRATQEGIEVHVRVQEARAKAFPDYRAEVKIERELERGGYRFLISGRMDGFFPAKSGRPPRIEEIKSSFSVGDLVRKLNTAGADHPYNLQLRTYGYFYRLEHGVDPELTFHLVSTRDHSSQDMDVALDPAGYERWMDRRLDELVAEVIRCEKRAERRRKVAASFPFPFERPRPGQQDLIRTIEEGMAEGRRMLVQAPTGLGKTAGVLYPALKEALARGQRVIYVTPKNSQHSVAEDAVERFQGTGAKVKSLTITAKSKICFKNEPLCNPDYCEYARDYYTKVHADGLLDILAKKRKLTASTFRKLGEEHEVCPFELQLDAAQEAETIICDYNYVFAPRAAFGRMALSTVGQEGKPNLVVDEAHNLPMRAMEYYSPALSTFALEKMREGVDELPKRFREDVDELIGDCIEVIKSCRPDDLERSAGGRGGGRGDRLTARIVPPAEPFLEQDGKLRSFLSRYLESDVEIQPRDVVLRLCFYWSEFTGALEFVSDPEHDEFFTTFQAHPSGGIVKITCCDASEMLKASYDEYDQVVAFSATLKPFEYYAKLSGLEAAEAAKGGPKTAEFTSPFPRSYRKLLIIPQISTKWSDRERNYPRVAEAISRIAALRPGNYFAFFPSFDFLERALAEFVPPPNFTVRRQEREMRLADVEDVLAHLREGIEPTVVFAVQGGVFSEGVDYPGKMIIGAFIVGPPLPSFDLEREQIRAYYESHYQAGFDYAYTYPAMAKAVQAAGRVIRSESDKGIIVLMDSRFVQSGYARVMPGDWFERDAGELVSNSILKEVSDFWASTDADEESDASKGRGGETVAGPAAPPES